MKITSVEVLLINSTIETSGNKEKDKIPRKWRPIIVKINTDEGIYGYGEVGLAYGIGASAGFGMVKDLAKLIIGMDPMNNEAIWEKLFKKTFWGQGGGTVVFAGMSGIDIALWDIRGKAMNVPVYKLLGGRCRDSLRVYASQIQFGWGDVWGTLTKPEEYAAAALAAKAQGYDCVKVDILENDYDGGVKTNDCTGVLPQRLIEMGIERLAAIREAVGKDMDIIIENHAETDVTSAIQLAKAMEPYRIMYYEEPCTPLNPKMMRAIKDKCDIPLAAGERIYTRWGACRFLEDRSLDVLQPDFGTCGGITEGKKISDMAHCYDVKIQGHVCGSPIAKAAALQLEFAIPNFIIHEHHRNSLLPGNVELCEHDYQPVNGRYYLPELPGIGQELTQRAYDLADRVVVD